MQKLSKRLQAAADFVTVGSCAADIGTDHGFLPIYLIQSGKCPRAVAMDIRKGPLERAQEHIAAAGLEHQIRVRLSDGMRELKKGEADSVVMTGMGGLTVLHILDDAQEMLADFREIILEPQSDIAKVRSYAREHQMYIDKEDLVYEAGKFYPVLHVAVQPRQKERMCQAEQQMYQILLEKLQDTKRTDDLFDQYGGCLIGSGHPVLLKMLERDEKRDLEILCGLEQGIRAAGEKQGAKETLQVRKKEVQLRLEEIQVLVETLALERYGKSLSKGCRR